jgi:hypothetical protein
MASAFAYFLFIPVRFWGKVYPLAQCLFEYRRIHEDWMFEKVISEYKPFERFVNRADCGC